MGGKQNNSKFRIEFKGGLKVLGTKKRVLASTRINSGVRNRESVPYGLVKRLSLRRLMESAQALEEEILDAFKERPPQLGRSINCRASWFRANFFII